MRRLRTARIIIPLFFIMACATMPLGREIEETLYPNGDYEECVELLPGQVLEYSFETSMPVDFNIHYHAKGRVFYPVKRDRVSSLSSRIDVDELSYYTGGERYFCLMWKNPYNRMGVTLRCRYRIVEKGEARLTFNRGLL